MWEYQLGTLNNKLRVHVIFEFLTVGSFILWSYVS
jgi:hypothetical protein